jgi:hypothetical protein
MGAVKKTGWIVLVFAAAMGVLIYSSFQGVTNHRVEVCVAYHGAKACQTASGQTEKEAHRTALDTACAQIASGMTDTVACQNTEPTSVKVLAGN